jgi:hypothetical protein
LSIHCTPFGDVLIQLPGIDSLASLIVMGDGGENVMKHSWYVILTPLL